ncbi:MAG: LPS-assembly protein LptD [Xanthobacteraceae bacterium]|nr:LPS-assembly protein LptD [Xanthobacteraceae bacterium]
MALVLSAFIFDAGFSLAPAQESQTSTPAVQLPGQKKPKSKKPATLSEAVHAKQNADPNAKMLVQANELVYDNQYDRVSAVGQVQIYYNGAILEADKVTFDRKTDRLFAQGNVIYKTKEGEIIYGDSLDLDRDFRDGFINSMLLETTDKTRFAAARADRSEGNLMVYQSGVYTACEPCKDDPKKPPLWQVKATRVIHNEGEKVIHYENASLEFFGQPIAWFPYFSHPDPTVKRKSGFLAPHFFSTSKIGAGVEIPYFWAMAPNYDTTFSVAPMTRQIGPLVKAEWRHRLLNGSYTIRAAGIFQQDKDAFIRSGTPPPGLSQFEPGYRNFRGSLESSGQFNITNKWSWGWDGMLLTDRTFPRDYTVQQHTASEKTNQLYLTGQGDRSYFDVRGMSFLGFSELDVQRQLPIIHPVLDYSNVIKDPVLGGEFGYRMNFTSLSRRQAEYNPINSTAAAITGTGYNSCDARAILLATNPSNCVMRGMPGDYTRATAEFNWRRTLINGWGQMFTPFMAMRSDIASRDANNDFNSTTAGSGSFIDPNRETLVRAMPTVGVETRWPFISVHSWGTQIFEPIAQMIVRPNETNIGRFPNEDAQSLIFDDTTLFAIDKYSGYDRVEGGTRANVGVQYTANINRFGMINMLFGQSYNLFGRNSFAYSGTIDPVTGQQTGLGLQSGLEQDVSDYVARIYFQPTGNLSFTSRFRFDKDNLDIHRFELETRSTWDRLSLSTIYARYDAQPLIGYLERREGIYQMAAYKFHDNWSISGGIRYDLDRGRVDLGTIGLSYIDECFAASFIYVADYTNIVDPHPVHKLMLRLNLRTLGGTGFSTSVGQTTGQ